MCLNVRTNNWSTSSRSNRPISIRNAPSRLVPNIDTLTEQIILSGMKIEAGERFQTADELIAALKGKFVSPSQKRAQQLSKVNYWKLFKPTKNAWLMSLLMEKLR